MPDTFWLTTALLSAELGMAWLALAMDVHWRQVSVISPRSPRTSIVLRALGSLALACSLVFCLLADTATMAVLVWMMLLAFAAVTIALVLSWRPRMLAPLVR